MNPKILRGLVQNNLTSISSLKCTIRLTNIISMDLNSYLRAVDQALRRGNAPELSKLLSLPLPFPVNSSNSAQYNQLIDQVNAKGSNLVHYCSDQLSHDNVLASIVSCRLLALSSLSTNELETAFRHEHAAYNATLDYFSAKDESETAAAIPLLVRVSNDLRVVAGMADSSKGNLSHELLREAVHDLTRGFTAVAKDRTPVSSTGSKKRAILAAVNVLFKIYFRLNTLQLCSKTIAVIEGPGHVMGNLSVFPVCDVVTYKFYVGRLKMYEDKFEDAREAFRLALKHCPPHSLRNRQRILAFLVPVEMCLGVMPSPQVGSKYGLHEYVSLAQAARVGDLRTFDQLFRAHRLVFIRLGTYLVLEQVRSIAYRNLIKRVHLISSSTRINVAAIEAALKWMGVDADMDEIECILSNLIFQSKVKGYLSHQKRVLVISKADPFPSVAVVKKAKV